ncbi:cytochrome c peroxidase [Frigidibacter sp. MR17.14]|uniref:cytochrome-c peroxidase n=1 Tax=Frigidibacter sp. MR17.14 TaxID=3126509 RepID=UPI003012B12C
MRGRAGILGSVIGGAAIAALAAVASAQTRGADTPGFDTPEALGRALFHDTDLSRNRTQSCATCHDPASAFTDPRETVVGRQVSLGDDGRSIGDRNAPSAAYAAFAPPFHKDAQGWIGGQFWDGRARDLAEQAGGPPVNPIEMGQPDHAAVVARLSEKPAYVAAFRRFYGETVLNDAESAYEALGKSIAAFEASADFSSFDSKYDRWLRGDYQMTKQEDLGRLLFFSNQFTNCNRCHQLKPEPMAPGETFTNYRFHNIGVPANAAVRAANGVGATDLGLGQNPLLPAAEVAAESGKYKVPSLRNVAVTGPYMHNGVFADLRTVVLFYNRYNSRAAAAQVNPETGAPWGDPEVPGTLSMTDLEFGPALDDKRIDALVAFLKTLTDARYEPLLTEQ